MSDIADLQTTAAALGVTYALAESGPPLWPTARLCWWCTETHNGVRQRGSSCPVVRVPASALSPERRRLREFLS